MDLARRFTILLALAALAVPLLISGQVDAQALQALKQAEKQTEATAQPAGQQSLESLLEPTVRKLVEQRLAEGEARSGDVASSEGGGDPFAALIDGARNSMNGITRGIDGVVAVWPLLPDEIGDAFILLTDFEGWPRMWTGILNLALMLLGGGVLAWMTRRMFGQVLVVPTEVRGRLMPALTVNMVVLLRDLLVLVVFVAAAFLISLIWFVQFDPMRIFLISYLAVTTVAALGWFLGNALFAPQAPERRMVAVDDRTASHMVGWITIVFGLVAMAGFSMGMLRLLGMPQPVLDIVQLAVGLLVTLVSVFVILRTPVATDRKPSNSSLGNMLHQLFGRYRRVWLIIASAMFLLLWSLSVFSPDPSKTVAVFSLFVALAAGLFVARLHGPPGMTADDTGALVAERVGDGGPDADAAAVAQAGCGR